MDNYNQDRFMHTPLITKISALCIAYTLKGTKIVPYLHVEGKLC